MNASKRTPGLWSIINGYTVKAGNDKFYIGYSMNQSQADLSAKEGAANAAFIVKAVNAHDELVEACQAFIDLWPVIPGRDEPKATPEVVAAWHKAHAVLAKVKGE